MRRLVKKYIKSFKTNRDTRQLTLAFVLFWVYFCALWYLSEKFVLVCLIAVGWPFIWLIWKFIKSNLECIAYTLRQIFK